MSDYVSTEPSSQFAQPRLDARALLGLYDPADSTDWGPIRAAQLNAGGQLALFLLGTNVVAAMLVTLVLQRVAPLWLLASWGAIAAAVAAAVTFRRLAARHRTAQTATVGDVRETVVEGIALAAIWSLPQLIFGAYAGPTTALNLWVVVSLLMTASAVAMAALPLATLIFLAIVGSSISWMMYFVGGPLLAAIALLFTALLMIGCFTRGKALVVIRASEIAVAERDETVSLLLR